MGFSFKIKKWPPRWAMTGLVVAVIAYMTLVPRPLPETDMSLIPGMDKIVHFLMFFGLSVTALADYSRRRRKFVRVSAYAAVTIAVISAMSGGLVELVQGWMNIGRGRDLWDFVADAAGAIAGAWIYMKFFFPKFMAQNE